MAIQEIIITGRKYRKCIDNTPNNKKWQRYSFWTKASDVWFDDGTTAQKKIGSFKGVTTNENQTAGYAADVTLVKSIKSSLTNLITNMSTALTALQNRLNTVINNLGGLRFYEDSTGKYVVGADSVPKKLGDTRDELAGNGSVALNLRYPTQRAIGLMFCTDGSKRLKGTVYHSDDKYETDFYIYGAKEPEKWNYVLYRVLFDPGRTKDNVASSKFDVDVSDYRYIWMRNGHIGDAWFIIDSLE